MPESLSCPSCRCDYPPPKKRAGKPVKCPLCGTVYPSSVEEPADNAVSPPPSSRKGVNRCPGCKKEMPRNITYCVACNLSFFNAWGDMEESAAGVGCRNELVGYGELAAKTLRICLYIITLRWWKILQEF